MNSVCAIHGHFVHYKNKRIHLKAFWAVVVGTAETTQYRLKEKVLFETVWIRGILYNPCGPLSVCCTIYFAVQTYITEIFQQKWTLKYFSIVPSGAFCSTFHDTGLLLFDNTAAISSNHTSASGPLLVIRRGLTYLIIYRSCQMRLFLSGSIPPYPYFSLYYMWWPAILRDVFRVLVFDLQGEGIMSN
jgi:hypothetical protein